jgi:protein arginine kinase activator
MMCQICGKNPAVFHYTEVIDNKVTKLSICQECALKKGLTDTTGKMDFSLGKLLSGLVEEDETLKEQGIDLQCEGCGTSYHEFRKVGRLGCAQCYTAFQQQMNKLLRRLHGSNRHTGEVSLHTEAAAAAMSNPEKIHMLKSELQSAIESEAFEKAAELRDRIREIEMKMKKEQGKKNTGANDEE